MNQIHPRPGLCLAPAEQSTSPSRQGKGGHPLEACPVSFLLPSAQQPSSLNIQYFHDKFAPPACYLYRLAMPR